jgi:mannose-6-phosphate isomerase class I
MQMRKFRWSKVYESAEEELVELLEHKHIPANRWTAEEGEESTKKYPVDMQLWCTEGQLTCAAQDKTYSLQAGDAMDIPAHVTCSLRGGFGGCACYESAAPKRDR